MTDIAEQPVTFDPVAVRAQFPILQTRAHGHPLVYLDNGATTQKPQAVIDAIEAYYASQNANIHRGVYQLSQVATEAYEKARHDVAAFINAPDPACVIFTRGTTEAINLVAASWGRANLKAGDEIIISAMEHHSNIVPWQLIAEQTGARVRVIPMNDAGELLMDEYAKLLNPRTKMVAVVHLSNSLGTINDVKEIVHQAHAVGAKVLIDGAQWVAHYPTDVQAIGCDFYAFSGHKLLGPTGIGVLWGKRALLDAMPPYQGGGDMIEQVTFERTTYAQLPNRFEAGTPNIAGGIGLGAAVRWLAQIGLANCAAHEHDLLDYATERLSEVPGLRIVGTARQKGSVVSFVIENPPMASLDIGAQLDQAGIAVRTGHHCCQPVMDRLSIASTSRASFALYNTRADVDALADALVKIRGESLARHAAHKVVAAAEGAELKYPVVSAGNPQAAADELVDVFEFLGDWNERYQYLIEMGEKLLPMPANEKNETNRVHGCQSTVHLSGRKQPGSGDRLDFLADSDADLVRGLIAILQKIYSGQRAGDILAFDIDAFFGRLGLDQHLTQGRRNGLAGMVQRIRALASIISGTKGQS